MSNPPNKILVIVGMHRSMTSLITQWLHKCGLQVGDDLYGVRLGNVKGHFEDKDFIRLHDYMLKINNSHWRETSQMDVVLDDYALEKSRSLIRLKNELYEQWGWKDPRTCLFLDHWSDLLPNAKYLIVYRPYHEVVDSLVRREFKVKNNIDYLLQWRKYASKYLSLGQIKRDNLKLWMRYNRSILEFVKDLPNENYMLLHYEQLIRDSDKVFNEVTENWGFKLEYCPAESIYDAGITKKATINSLKGIDENLIEKAAEIQDELMSYSNINF